MSLGFAQPWALWLLLLAVIPWWCSGQRRLQYSSLLAIPEDRLSTWIDRSLRGIGVLAAVFLALALAGPFLRERPVEKIGTGAHIVLLVDHSSSMNENFSGTYMGGNAHESKSAWASTQLAEFIGRRPADLFGLVAFSAAPIYVLPLTQDLDAVRAGVLALGGRGHGITHIAPALAMALQYFDGQPVTGSRVVLFVSDGAARIEAETADALRQTFQQQRTALYWIYLRNPKASHLSQAPNNPNESTTPEYFLHQYFQTLGVPYHAYEADNPAALQQAIADVERLENHPLRYQQILPRDDWSGYCYAAAWVLVLLMLIGQCLEIDTWRQ